MSKSEDNDIGVVKNHNIRNPYVIIIGISDYSKSKKNINNLPAVAEDVKNMYDLFKNEFSYKYGHKIYYLHTKNIIYNGIANY